MRRRLRKQVTVVAILVLVFGAVMGIFGVLVYEPPPPPPPPPPTFSAIDVRETQMLGAEDGRGDLYALVKNPNAQAGAESVTYAFEFRVEGRVVETVPGSTFLLPGQEKAIVVLNQAVPAGVTELAIRVAEPRWQIVSEGFREPALVPVSRTTRELPGSPVLYEVKGELANESNLDYLRVEVSVLGRDAAGELLGVGKTFLGSLLAGERREFTVSWPLPPGRSVADLRIFPEVNLLSPAAVQPRAGEGTIEDRRPLVSPQ